ncbi:MAG TPA: hypothetical protein VGY30_00520 [Solirubrobacteraceae bacterium]|jgi:hypothetical protein|nr:hypothetical protein [Solirubrobacteraceae bacterium]
MPTHTVSHQTREALEEIRRYSEPETNEPITLTLSRLTDDLFTDSFLGGGALVNPPGDTLESENSEGFMLASDGGSPTSFAIELSINLTTAQAHGKWTLPDGSVQTPSFYLNYVQSVDRPEGRLLLFDSQGHSDGAVYSVSMLLE